MGRGTRRTSAHGYTLAQVPRMGAPGALGLAHVASADAALARYGQFCYDSGRSLHDFSETTNAIVQGRREWRRQTERAWGCARAWRRLFPVRNHKPMSVALLLAMLTVALEHQLPLLAAAIGVGLLGLLRPDELLKLRIGDLLLPDPLLAAPDTMFVQLGKTKTSHRGGAVHQHVRVTDSVLVPFAQTLTRPASLHVSASSCWKAPSSSAALGI